VTIISNTSRDTLEAAAWRVPTGAIEARSTPLGLSWPDDVFSLSHVAIPFEKDDPVYGTARRGGPAAERRTR
jgi:hypothetical protein